MVKKGGRAFAKAASQALENEFCQQNAMYIRKKNTHESIISCCAQTDSNFYPKLTAFDFSSCLDWVNPSKARLLPKHRPRRKVIGTRTATHLVSCTNYPALQPNKGGRGGIAWVLLGNQPARRVPAPALLVQSSAAACTSTQSQPPPSGTQLGKLGKCLPCTSQTESPSPAVQLPL